MNKWLIALSAIGLVFVADEVYAQVRLRQLMMQKLQASQKLLGAIATSDFKQIRQQVDQLSQIANQEEWMADKTAQYKLHSNDFRRALDTIARKAKEKNIDGVTLGYFDLTSSCVRCHQYTREVRDAALPNTRPGRVIAFGRSSPQP